VSIALPEGKRFAFTIMDDTDVGTAANLAPVYRLLSDLGLRTTKTVWTVGCPEGSPDFGESETLEDPGYLEFVKGLRRQGFEIAYHGPTMESSNRERIERGWARYCEWFGGPPRVYANHAYNRENLYWGAERLDSRILRALYSRSPGKPQDFYQGHRPGSESWWGDLAGEIEYVRNLTFSEVNLLRVNPSMPYHDSSRSLVRWWFSASDAEGVREFNALLSPAAQDRLEAEGGVCIVATHLGKGFASGGEVHPVTRALLTRLAGKAGWFVPVGELLDRLRALRGDASGLPASEWRRMQWRWAWDLVRRRLGRRSP